MLHFNRDLSQQKITGGFGWDIAGVVPIDGYSYHGTSSYLLMTKYNRYAGWDDDGVNKIAILDPNVAEGRRRSIPVHEGVTDHRRRHERVHPGQAQRRPQVVHQHRRGRSATDSVLANSETGFIAGTWRPIRW